MEFRADRDGPDMQVKADRKVQHPFFHAEAVSGFEAVTGLTSDYVVPVLERVPYVR